MKNKFKLVSFILFIFAFFVAPSAWANYWNTGMLKICNSLNAYGYIKSHDDQTKGTQLYPIKHNLEYVLIPAVSDVVSTQDLSGVIPWLDWENNPAYHQGYDNEGCKDARFNTQQAYPINADLKIMDQQTGITLWHGTVTFTSEHSITFDPMVKSIDANGEMISFYYFNEQITISRS